MARRSVFSGFISAAIAAVTLVVSFQAGADGDSEQGLAENPLRNAYFCDLHLHTSDSYDAAWGGNTTTPAEAYQYAQGYEVEYLGRKVRRKVPDSVPSTHQERAWISPIFYNP